MEEDDYFYSDIMFKKLKELEGKGIFFDERTLQIIFFISYYMEKDGVDEEDEDTIVKLNYVYLYGEDEIISLAKSFVLKEKIGCVYPPETEFKINEIKKEIEANDNDFSIVNEYISIK